MCWLAALRPNQDFTEEQFHNAYDSNSHGSGFAYNQNGKIYIEKGFTTFKSFYEAYSKIDKTCSRLVHHRFATGGEHNETNSHPFEVVKDKLCFAHNGIISGFPSTKEHSDTYLFTEKIIKPLISNRWRLIHQWHVCWLLGESIGTNKLAFLDCQGAFIIINSQQGYFERDGEVWISGKAHEYGGYKRKQNKTNFHMWQDDDDGATIPVNQSTSLVLNGETYMQWLTRHYLTYVEKKKQKVNSCNGCDSNVANSSDDNNISDNVSAPDNVVEANFTMVEEKDERSKESSYEV